MDHIGENTNAQNQIAIKRRLSDFLAEYEQKVADAKSAVEAFHAAGETLKTAACISGTWGQTTINIGSVYESCILDSLLKSAWRHVYEYLSIDKIASAEDKKALSAIICQSRAVHP